MSTNILSYVLTVSTHRTGCLTLSKTLLLIDLPVFLKLNEIKENSTPPTLSLEHHLTDVLQRYPLHLAPFISLGQIVSLSSLRPLFVLLRCLIVDLSPQDSEEQRFRVMRK